NGGHLAHVVLGSRLVVNAALAHDIGAHRAVGHLGADVDGAGFAIQRVQVFGEALPLPLDALGQGRAGNVFHVFHDFDHALALAVIGAAGGKTDAAVAHDQRGDAVVGSGAAQGIPGGLAIHV